MKLHFYLSLFLLSGSVAMQAQTLTPAQKDSLVAVTCDMVKQDQKYRQYPYSDSVNKAYKAKDTAAIYHFSSLLTTSDSTNFRILEGIIKRFGYPGEKMLGPKACNLQSVFIHWENGYPQWLNDPSLVKLMKKEIQKGNMPVALVDSAHVFFVRHTMHDAQFLETINATRKTLLLKQYTEEQFMRQEPIPHVKK